MGGYLERSAVLIDLDNLVGTKRDGACARVDSEEVEFRIVRAIKLAGPAEFVLAVGNQAAWKASWAALIGLGVPGRIAAPGRDAADRELIEQAEHLWRHGFTTITVVSGDHVFAQLGNLPGLHLRVLAPTSECASRQLVAAGESFAVVATRSSRRRWKRRLAA